MTTAPRRLRRVLLGVALVALGIPAAAGANHLPDPEGFGHNNVMAGMENTSTTCNGDVGQSCLYVTQNSPGGGIWTYVSNALSAEDALLAQTNSTNASGNAVQGSHLAGTGIAPAVLGTSVSGSHGAIAVQGLLDDTTAGGGSAGVYGHNRSTTDAGIGVMGEQDGSGWGVYGETPTGRGVFGLHSGTTGIEPGVYGVSNSDALNASGVQGVLEGSGAAAGSAAVYGIHGGTGALGIGVRGHHSGGGNGVYGSVQNSVVNAAGVLGQVLSTGGGGVGVYGAHNGSGYGVYGNAFGAGGAGVVGQAPAGPGWAGYFTGNVHVTGALSKGGGAFKIDHPLDPANRYLQHSFVESPDMLNVYNGNVRTDGKGFATVWLPRYFSALNRDFRYQLTPLGRAGWDARAGVWQEISRNRFTIRTDKPNVEVSWQVTGIRKDRWANANRIQVEQAKAASERGRYLNPELYGASKARSLLKPPPAPRVPAGKAPAMTRGGLRESQ